MAAQGLAFATLPAAQLASFQGIILILAAVTPETYAVVLFTVLRTLAGFARQIVERIAGLTAAELARSFAASDQASLTRLYAYSGRLIGGLTGLLVGLVWVFTPSFLEVWAKGQVHHHPAVLACLLAALALGSPGLLSMGLFHQVNRPRPLVGIMSIQTVMALALTALLGGRYGAAAAAFAVATSEFVAGSILLPWYGRRAFLLPGSTYVARTWLAAFIGGAISLPIAQAAMDIVGHETLWQHVVAGNAWAAAIAFPAIFIVADAQQRHWLMRRLRTSRAARRFKS
jgi:O-antigen/teichoic acid export membrane protein